MKNNTSSRDFEQLSAYLDGQLKPAKRARLEKRLREEPGLKFALDDLRNTRRMLQSLPKARVPRNFTLSPGMVVIKPSPRVFPAMGFVSAIASILLVVVLLSDWLGGATFKMASRSAEALQVVETVQVEMKVAAADTVEAEAAPMLALEEAPAESLTDESPSVGAPEAETSLMFAAPPAGTPVTVGEGITETADVVMKALEIPPSGEEELAQPTQTNPAASLPTETPAAKRLPEHIETPTVFTEVARAPEEGMTADSQLVEAEEIVPSHPAAFIWLRILEGLLLFTAFAAGITAVVQWRKRVK